ncbi:DEAD/DEAH box helicase [Halalkalicoccus jeotgali]|uniref:DEAD/H associated domain protein n=1 Tax=Halalkalicoccus jeotgali (strain DSM 18796 / CECT 7217 / JCM 14584 / KCTC 4019 / B3) TaxID=795797 RepID=D8J3F8_HALJB|nr:DEAD/DEAH box helicase [Halalkalicoccus jeotgali]ADJ15265.1 DEAD/H associated domain protein [Halalkalicoccus jeotgali B3]ELY35314.1 DEAD/H associated domain-containing protein [Halalkalicoccus jeotgali B3]
MSEQRAVSGSATFTHLGSEVRAALSERGFQTPTAPQRAAIAPLAAGENALVIAPTGTGKTETAMLPVFDSITRSETPFGLSALYITPLRALNRDMRERLDWWGERLGIEIAVRHGDTSDYQRQKQANDPPDVLVTTPETVQAMLTGSKLREALSDIEFVVVDEVHELAASKRGAQMAIALERLVKLAGDFQRIGLSATVGDPESVGAFLTGNRPCEICEVEAGSRLDLRVLTPEIEPGDEGLASELVTEPEMASHVRAIREVVEENESTLIFVNTRQTAEALGSRFNVLEANIGVHHGSLAKDARIEVEDAFKAGELDGLLCTSSMELGIDVGQVDHVVQYSSPREVSRLLQRVGRAGHRSDQVSQGTVIATSPDDALEALAIVDRARRGDVERAAIHTGSLDTLANQISGLVMGHGEIGARKAYEIVTHASPFAELPEETFREVVRELSNNRIIWLDEESDSLEKSGGTWQYVYANLSMIPDEATFEVRDVASGRGVGTLDERFVTTFAEPGATFIQRGEMWRIVEIEDEEEKVRVSPVENPTGEIPSWVGQEIPVPQAVAENVGELRRVAAPQFEGGATRESVAREFVSRYPTDRHTASEALSPIERHVETGHPIPDEDRLLIEFSGGTVVVNACFGHKVNETLGRLLSALLGQRTGSSVGLETDPYRIELTVPSGIAARDVVEVLEGTDPEHVEALIELSLKNSDALKFRLAQVAAKFGALKSWQGSRERISMDRLLGALEDTPMYEEAVREVFHEDLDVPSAARVLERVQSGELALSRVGERTPLGIGGRSSSTELLSPENADASVIETVRERIKEDRVLLACLHCKEWDRTQKVERVAEQPECPNCGSTMVAALNPWAEEVVEAVRKNEKDTEEEKATRRAYTAASLVQGHGKQAVIALAARGVGPRNAAYIINNHRESEDDFYRDILEKEREYARTQAFW